MVSNDTWHTEFAYDGLSRRIESREYTNGSLGRRARGLVDFDFQVEKQRVSHRHMQRQSDYDARYTLRDVNRIMALIEQYRRGG